MKLDPTVMRTMDKSDFRVLEAIERGMKDHYIVPLPLINSMAGLRHGGSHKIISSLLRDKLISHERKKGMDGYRITTAGYDILALYNLKSRGYIVALGQKIGTGKESDIYLAANNDGKQIVLKFHRLGRTSFRNVRKKRDYFNNTGNKNKSNAAHSWLFLSKLSAIKEYMFMKALYEHKYPTPEPIIQNRHIICMSLVRGMPLYQIYPKQVSIIQATDIYIQTISIAKRLATKHGLIHCDLNEFNILVDLSGIQTIATCDLNDPYVRHSGQSIAPEQTIGVLSKPAWEQSLLEQQQQHHENTNEPLPEPLARLSNNEPKPIVTLIDFPQMISINHPNAKELYERDIACLRKFFEMKLKCTIPDEIDNGFHWDDIMTDTLKTTSSLDCNNNHNNDTNDNNSIDNEKQHRLDEDLRASGFITDQENKDLELYYFQSGPKPVNTAIDEEEEEDQNSSNSNSDDLHEYNDDDNVNNDDGDDNSNNYDYDDDDGSDRRSVDEKDIEHLDSVNDNNVNSNIDIEQGQQQQLENLRLLDDDIQNLNREKMEQIAKERVRKQIEEQKRKSRTKTAFRKGNANKKYVKGKRIIDSLI